MTMLETKYMEQLENQRTNREKERETKRSNEAKERETHRANVVSEQHASNVLAETERSNRANEALKMDTLKETIRSNLARESETQRHNITSENQTRFAQAETERHNKELETLQLEKLGDDWAVNTRKLALQEAQLDHDENKLAHQVYYDDRYMDNQEEITKQTSKRDKNKAIADYMNAGTNVAKGIADIVSTFVGGTISGSSTKTLSKLAKQLTDTAKSQINFDDWLGK